MHPLLLSRLLQLSHFVLGPNVREGILVDVVVFGFVVDGVLVFFLVDEWVVDILDGEPVSSEEVILEAVDEGLLLLVDALVEEDHLGLAFPDLLLGLLDLPLEVFEFLEDVELLLVDDALGDFLLVLVLLLALEEELAVLDLGLEGGAAFLGVLDLDLLLLEALDALDDLLVVLLAFLLDVVLECLEG